MDSIPLNRRTWLGEPRPHVLLYDTRKDRKIWQEVVYQQLREVDLLEAMADAHLLSRTGFDEIDVDALVEKRIVEVWNLYYSS